MGNGSTESDSDLVRRDGVVAAQLRQQRRQGLRRGLPGAQARGIGGMDLRIELHGVVVYLHQVPGLRRAHEGERDPGGDGYVLHDYPLIFSVLR